MKAHLRSIRISPKKANLVAGTVRGKPVNEALDLLKFMPKKGADILYKVIYSAASNAKNNYKQSIDELTITQILVTKGMTYKRSIPISRGRVQPIRKRTCHITVEVGVPGSEMPTPVSQTVKLEKTAKSEKAHKKSEKEKSAKPAKAVKKAPAAKKPVNKTTTPESGQAK